MPTPPEITPEKDVMICRFCGEIIEVVGEGFYLHRESGLAIERSHRIPFFCFYCETPLGGDSICRTCRRPHEAIDGHFAEPLRPTGQMARYNPMPEGG